MPLREMNREQAWLLPPTLDELVPPDHPARFVAEFVDALDGEDWRELGVQPDGEPLGAPAYHPRALLSVWLYGFMTNMRSCHKLEAACRDQIPYLFLRLVLPFRVNAKGAYQSRRPFHELLGPAQVFARNPVIS